MGRHSHSQPRIDFAHHTKHPNAQMVYSVFREPVHQILEKIKSEPYFKWLTKIVSMPPKIVELSVITWSS